MNSDQISQRVQDWAREQNFTAPYGVLADRGRSAKGRMYQGITFGYAGTLDAHVRVFNRNFMLYESSAGERQVFPDADSLMAFLRDRFATQQVH